MQEPKPLITLIAAMDKNWAIGKKNGLLCDVPEDMQHFLDTTTAKPIIMGRRTAESLGKALPFRRNIVLSRNGQVPFAGMHGARTVKEALSMAGVVPEIMVIGGGHVYARFLGMADRMILTWLDFEAERVDTYFPRFQEEEWKVVSRRNFPVSKDRAIGFSIVDYRRRRA